MIPILGDNPGVDMTLIVNIRLAGNERLDIDFTSYKHNIDN